LDYALAFLILTPLRCRKCRLRFYRPWFMVRRAASSGVPEVETRSALPAISSPPLAAPPDATLLAEETPPSILLVDEDAAMRKLLAMLLHREGYTVHHAADPDEAMAALSTGPIDVVVVNLSDNEQPVAIRTWLSAYPELGIIALSSGNETKVSLNGTSENNLLTLPLPSRPRNVVQAIQRLLDGSRMNALPMEPARIEPSRATQCAPQSSARTPRIATGSRP
jgi:CheY-like chemotaxis protein